MSTTFSYIGNHPPPNLERLERLDAQSESIHPKLNLQPRPPNQQNHGLLHTERSLRNKSHRLFGWKEVAGRLHTHVICQHPLNETIGVVAIPGQWVQELLADVRFWNRKQQEMTACFGTSVSGNTRAFQNISGSVVLQPGTSGLSPWGSVSLL